MKSSSFSLSIVLFFCFGVCLDWPHGPLFCYVERESGGLFDKIASAGAAVQPKPKVTFEPREDSRPADSDSAKNISTESSSTCVEKGYSLVFNIQGMEQFTRLVVKNSYSKPVVLKLYSPISLDSAQEMPVFQAIADEFKSQVIFAGLNVMQNQNMDIFKQIATFCRLEKVDLPLFLFYKKGQLIMPFLAGFQPQVSLSGYIQKRFFATDESAASNDEGPIN